MKLKKYNNFLNESNNKEKFIKHAQSLFYAIKKKSSFNLKQTHVRYNPSNDDIPNVLLVFEVLNDTINFKTFDKWELSENLYINIDNIKSCINSIEDIMHSLNIKKILIKKNYDTSNIEIGFRIEEDYIKDNEDLLKSYSGIKKYFL